MYFSFLHLQVHKLQGSCKQWQPWIKPADIFVPADCQRKIIQDYKKVQLLLCESYWTQLTPSSFNLKDNGADCAISAAHPLQQCRTKLFLSITVLFLNSTVLVIQITVNTRAGHHFPGNRGQRKTFHFFFFPFFHIRSSNGLGKSCEIWIKAFHPSHISALAIVAAVARRCKCRTSGSQLSRVHQAKLILRKTRWRYMPVHFSQ